MFCPKCGNKLVDGAKFCSSCGASVESLTTAPTPPPTQVNRQEQWSSQWSLQKQPVNKPKSKRTAPKWIIPVLMLSLVVIICFGLLISSFANREEAKHAALDYVHEHYCSTFAAEVDSIEKNGRNQYLISYDVDQDYDLWESTGTVKMSVCKENGEWFVNVIDDAIQYSFEKNDNWYYITGSRNSKYLVKMIAINDKKVTLEYYSYQLGSYGGPDDYDHETTSCEIRYSGKNRCFTFDFMGNWRINGSYISYNQFEVGANYEQYQSSGDYTTLKPVDPAEYWWYEEAKRQTGDYDSGVATDISQVNVGDVITFGTYEMDNDTANGTDNVSWLVLDETEDSILVISKYCIASQQTSDTYDTWETSVARNWLNGEFYDTVFTEDEKSRILTTTVVNDDNPDTGMKGGNDTADKLFLLSIDEANKYFSSSEDRIAYGTLYLQKLVDEDEDAFGWWLRTPGKRFSTLSFSQIYQTYVGSGGYVSTEGCTAAVYNNGLRPAMWISK